MTVHHVKSGMRYLALLSTLILPAMAGPIIIDGTDANDHGFVSGGVNQQGWAYMQRALENLASQCTGCVKVIRVLGGSPEDAGVCTNVESAGTLFPPTTRSSIRKG